MTFKLNSDHKLTITTDQVWHLLDLVSNDNTLKSDILEEKFKDILDTFYSKLEEAQSKQPTPDWED